MPSSWRGTARRVGGGRDRLAKRRVVYGAVVPIRCAEERQTIIANHERDGMRLQIRAR